MLPEILVSYYIGADGKPVVIDDLSAFEKCPEVTTHYEKECFIIVGEDPAVCREGKCIIRTVFDCSAEEGSQYITTVEGIINPVDGATLPVGTADGEATIVPCPTITTVSDTLCSAGKA